MASIYAKACEPLMEDFKHAREINRENLRLILADNRDTVYGKKMQFGDILTPEAFAERVPLTDYETYGERLTVPGEFTAYPFDVILCTSGTTGSQKIFPLTRESLRRYSSYAQNLPYSIAGVSETDRFLHTSVFRSNVNGMTILSDAHHRWMDQKGMFDFDSFAGGRELLFADDVTDIPYVKAWLAFCHPELVAIQSIFIYDISLLFGFIEKEWRTVIADMRARRVSADLNDRIKEILYRELPDEAWLDELTNILEEGFDTPIIPRIWKKMRFVCGIGGKMHVFQERAVRRYLGGIDVNYFGYGSSECMVSVAVGLNKAEYAILPRSGYYEFIPKGEEVPVTMEQLEVGKKYELILTTFSGLYRYQTGDLIQINSFIGETPIIEIAGRKKHIIDIAGEKIDSHTATEAVCRWAEAVHAPVHDFAMGVDTRHTPSFYHLFIEWDERVGVEADPVSFDNVLRDLSFEYNDVRDLGMVGMPRIHFLSQGEISGSNSSVEKPAHSKPHIFLDESRLYHLLGESGRNEE